MNLKIKWFFIVLTVVLVISITPACAVKMGDVGDDATKYNMESKNRKGFFAKIKFIAKGFKLIDKAKSAEKESKNNINNTSDGNGYESKWKQNQIEQQIQQKLLYYRNSKENIDINTINNTSTGNTICNNTNITNVTNNNSIVRCNITLTIPWECEAGAENIIRELGLQHNITLLKKTESDINKNLKGNIVQIIDERGHIRYLDVKSFDNNTVTLVSYNNKEFIMSIDYFKKAFTGFVLLDNNFENHYQLVDNINKLQKNQILKETEDAHELKDKAQTNTIINGILTGLGLVLFIIGITLAIIYSKPASTEAELQMTELGNEISNELDSEVSSSSSSSPNVDWDPYYGYQPAPPSGGGTPELILEPEPTFSTQSSLNSSNQAINNYSAITLSPGLQFKLNSQKIKYSLSMGVGGVSTIMAVIALVELIINASSNTWLRIILGIVGLILILVGTAFMIYGIINGFDSVGNLITSNALLKKLKNDNKDMNDWLKIGSHNNDTLADKNNTDLNNTSLVNKNKYGEFQVGSLS